MQLGMFHIKICGITIIEDAQTVAAAGADAIGLNFYDGSPRYVSIEQAAEIAAAIPSGVVRVGVFVNAITETICETVAAVGLDWVQLHGDELPELLDELPNTARVLRAFRLRDEDVTPILEYVSACQQTGRVPDAVLVDAFDSKQYGGTGQTVAWRSLRDERLAELGQPIVLAGGLTPDNVAEAIRAAGPTVVAVDTASGVESSPGIKGPDRVRRFVEQARRALGC